MTVVLCDAAERLPDLAGGPGNWIARDPTALARDDRALWRALGGRESLWELARTGTPRGGGEYWSRVLVTTEAASSQFDALRDRFGARNRPPGPLACLALGGSGFHGHRGRPWSTLAGNLHLSIALPDPGIAARAGIAVTALPAVAVVDTVLEVSGGSIRPGIKWVNDIVVEGRKVAGVISTSQTQGGRIGLAVLGIGLNVERRPSVAPNPFTPEAACLRGLPGGETASLFRTFWSLLDAVSRRHGELMRRGPGPLLEAYRRASLVAGRRVRVYEEGLDEGAPPRSWPPPLARGIVRGVGDDLSLRIEGVADPVTRGRLAFEEACAAFGLV